MRNRVQTEISPTSLSPRSPLSSSLLLFSLPCRMCPQRRRCHRDKTPDARPQARKHSDAKNTQQTCENFNGRQAPHSLRARLHNSSTILSILSLFFLFSLFSLSLQRTQHSFSSNLTFSPLLSLSNSLAIAAAHLPLVLSSRNEAWPSALLKWSSMTAPTSP